MKSELDKLMRDSLVVEGFLTVSSNVCRLKTRAILKYRVKQEVNSYFQRIEITH